MVEGTKDFQASEFESWKGVKLQGLLLQMGKPDSREVR
jgi:hypothetical protein